MQNTEDKFIEFEITNRCFLKCPACSRTLNRKKNKIPNVDLDLGVISKCLKHRDFEEVILSGNHGDPIYHPQFHDLILLIKKLCPQAALHIETNGAFREPQWWKTTGEILSSKDMIVFSIDGVPKNNHFYRINSNWESVEEGVETLRKFTKAHMRWKYIRFRYNEANIDQAYALSKKMGFQSFVLVESCRFTEDDIFRPTGQYNV